MISFRHSIALRFSIFATAFVIMAIGLAVFGVMRLHEIDIKTEGLDKVHLATTQLLGEVSDRVSEFRLAEAYRALNPDATRLATAESLAETHRKAIEELLQEYSSLMGAEADEKDLRGFRDAWNTYLAAHNAWIASDTDGKVDDPAYFGSDLHRLYRSADNASDRLIEDNAVQAHREADEVDQLVDQTTNLMYVASAIAILLGAWLLFRVRTTITQPLATITLALSRLAAGHREIEVPELARKDEIGEMAKAFDVFRANSVALEKAHAETREAQEQAQEQARHDPLTGLPNRRLFSAELQTGLMRAQHGPSAYAIMLIDLDNFKQINDLQGHAVGDLVLCEVAARLSGVMRKTDTVARLGGDEFAIIAEIPLDNPDWTVRLAGRILSAIREPIRVGDGSIEISASIGVAYCPVDGKDADALLHAADIAMYRAKHDGRNAFRFFEQGMDDELRAQAALEADLRQAIADGEIKPQYQPLIDMGDQHIYGFEVLARWQHPTRGSVAPDTFIPMAEQLGLISELTTSILTQACREALPWGPDVLISVNISPLQLKDATLPTQILSILNRENFPPSRLELEVTETALVNDIGTAKQILTALQSIGIKIALDDFGTGYSSLYHLRELSFDKVKIDRSFVQSMQENGESGKIIDAILSLAKSMRMPTVAEGIENAEVLQLLIDKGCEFGQGYLIGKAMTALKVVDLLADQSAASKTALSA
jgi:diguanylate cyclase (GGDEF)-like protein